jgi:hypothetical protein
VPEISTGSSPDQHSTGPSTENVVISSSPMSYSLEPARLPHRSHECAAPNFASEPTVLTHGTALRFGVRVDNYLRIR